MGTHSTSTPPTAGTLRILDVPKIGSGLTPEQIRGAACVWCPAQLHAGTGIDLSARQGTFMGQPTVWYPRGCRACTHAAARAQYESHPSACEQCVDDPALCDTRSTLRRIVLETQ